MWICCAVHRSISVGNLIVENLHFLHPHQQTRVPWPLYRLVYFARLWLCQDVVLTATTLLPVVGRKPGREPT
jgi:hypothetical protein